MMVDNASSKMNWYDELKLLSKRKLEAFKFKKLEYLLMNNESIGDIPSVVIGRLFNPTVLANEFGNEGKSTLESILIKNKNKDIVYTMKNPTENLERLHRCFSNVEYTKSLYDKAVQYKKNGAFDKEMKELYEHFVEEENPVFLDFQFYFFHTIEKPLLIGPKSLYVTEGWNIYFISPLCIVADEVIKCSGFHFVDTFLTHYRFIFEFDIDDNGSSSYKFNTRLSVEFEIEILSQNFLTWKIKADATEENKVSFGEKFFPLFDGIWKKQTEDYYSNRIFICSQSASTNIPTKVFEQRKLDDDDFAFSHTPGSITGFYELLAQKEFLAFLLVMFILVIILDRNSFLFIFSVINSFMLLFLNRKISMSTPSSKEEEPKTNTETHHANVKNTPNLTNQTHQQKLTEQDKKKN